MNLLNVSLVYGTNKILVIYNSKTFFNILWQFNFLATMLQFTRQFEKLFLCGDFTCSKMFGSLYRACINFIHILFVLCSISQQALAILRLSKHYSSGPILIVVLILFTSIKKIMNTRYNSYVFFFLKIWAILRKKELL